MTLCRPETNENQDIHKIKHVLSNLFVVRSLSVLLLLLHLLPAFIRNQLSISMEFCHQPASTSGVDLFYQWYHGPYWLNAKHLAAPGSEKNSGKVGHAVEGETGCIDHVGWLGFGREWSTCKNKNPWQRWYVEVDPWENMKAMELLYQVCRKKMYFPKVCCKKSWKKPIRSIRCLENHMAVSQNWRPQIKSQKMVHF